jgi:hypothetical protein
MEGISNGNYLLSPNIAVAVIDAARSGDVSACEVIHWAGEELGWLAVSVARQIGMEKEELEIIQSGSVFKAGEIITDPMRRIVLEHCPQAKLIRLDGPPVVGAIILGMEQARFDGYPIRDSIIKTAKALLE